MNRPPLLDRRTFGAGLAIVATSLALSGCGESSAAHEETLYFTAIPDQNTTELIQKFAPVAVYLSEQLGVPVEYKPTADYPASVEAFKNGDVQLAWFGGVTGVQARQTVSGARAIAQGKVDPEYVSYFIAHVDAGIEPTEDFPTAMVGKKFTFGSSDSTSGRVMPEFFIREATGKSPEDFFGIPNAYSGAHDKTAKLVEAGTFDCGALSYKKYDSMVKQGKLDPAKCVKVWTTPSYPDYNWTAHPDLDERYGPGFTDKVQKAIVSVSDPALLAALQREEGMIAATNADFESIAETMVSFGHGR
ncbi:MAG: putative selenate ABC transporter substrate-binding protein [bacterium]|nr:putative selenate ABC transporter substrate-binding protein [bacterium]